MINLIAAGSTALAGRSGDPGELARLWRAPVGTDGSSSPVPAGDRIRAGTAHGLAGLDPATGAVIRVQSAAVSGTPAMVGGKLIFGSRDGILHAVSSSGEPLWHVALGAPSGPPVLMGRALFATTDPPVRAPRIVALDAGSGRALARADVPAGTSAVIDGAVVVATSDGRLIAYRPPRA